MKKISRIENDAQDRTIKAWQELCSYVDELAENGDKEFSPAERLGPELFSQIHTLPESIGKLKNVTKMWLYGSKLKRIPPEIGLMESLEFFDPYTSYDLHWFPYEITNCKKLKDSRISTRALYGNYKYRNGFPRLKNNPIRYQGDKLNCSICQKTISYDMTNQLWISLRIGTDVVPLLVNSCSSECESNLPKPPDNYVQKPHKGGHDLVQPLTEDEQWDIEYKQRLKEEKKPESKPVADKQVTKNNKPKPKVFKLIRKLWDK